MTGALLALWNGARPEALAEYETWHGIEHAPERLGAPGFRFARRYRAEEGAAGGFFTWYGLDDLGALETPAYAALQSDPTAWSARMRRSLTGFRRLPGRILAEEGRGLGGALVTLRRPGPAAAAWAALAAPVRAALRQGALLRYAFAEAAQQGQAYSVFPDAPAPGEEGLLLLEGTEPGPLAGLATRLAAPGDELGQWRLLQSVARSELPEAARQAPRDDLETAWRGGGAG
ncbi:hypothetical protein [Pseudoroseomonas cervicalis]|uniref:hypothetical protein n=1 Tax=Teichococcus cervicalis TaxID=204525 RepID=UPI0022F1B851|nr:hypothetical protein [Pseudoroseomonas cervicalis]WBV45146.1 hypothetical protein PFY06_20110 [Pseudoroseomonas cervicalis]